MAPELGSKICLDEHVQTRATQESAYSRKYKFILKLAFLLPLIPIVSYNLYGIFRPLNELLCSGSSSQLAVLLAQEFAYLLFTNIVIEQITCSMPLHPKINRNPLKTSRFAKKR